MKKIKKLLAMIMAMTMVLGLGLTSFAAGNTSTITINNAGNGKFAAVQIIEEDATKDTGWDFVDGYAGYFTASNAFDTTDTQAIIKGMIASQNPDAEEAESIENFDTKYAAALNNVYVTIKDDQATLTSPFTVDKAGVWVIKGVEEGYSYSPMAAYVGFDYTSGKPSGLLDAAEINAKKAPTTIGKSNDDEDKVVEIGKEVGYTITSTVPFIPTTDVNRSYQIADRLTGAAYALETEGDHQGQLKINVKIGGSYDEDWYVTPMDQSTPGTGTVQSFILDLSSLLENNTYANQTITITYTAIVKDLVVGNDVIAGNGENEQEFGQGSDKLITGSVTLTKTDEESNLLKGAEFVLLKTLENGTTVYAQATDNGNGDYTLNGWVESEDDATHLVTTEAGTFTINGLEKDVNYAFKEVKAPDGYSINDENATIRWNDVPADLANSVTGTASMVDTKLASLPGTGGIGTTIFTIGGCAIMIAAAALYFVNRRKSEEN